MAGNLIAVAPAPRLTVITVCFNAAATIQDTLDSVAGQSWPDREHVVVDGGSTDGTREILERNRDRLAVLVSEPDRGLYDAMNKGLHLARGDYAGFLNADDVFADRDALASIAQALAPGDVDACHGDLVYVDARDTARVVRWWKSREFEPGLVARGWMPAHPTFYCRRELLLAEGGFDIRYRLQADYELMLRLFERRRIRSRYLPRLLVRMRTGGQTNRSIGNVVRGNLEAWRAWRELGFGWSPWFMVRKVASRLPQFLGRPR
jgi:glycosyltransferase involved in cell wall biosynthesis